MKKAVTQGFSTFPCRLRAKAQFERRPVPETLMASPSTDLHPPLWLAMTARPPI